MCHCEFILFLDKAEATGARRGKLEFCITVLKALEEGSKHPLVGAHLGNFADFIRGVAKLEGILP